MKHMTKTLRTAKIDADDKNKLLIAIMMCLQKQIAHYNHNAYDKIKLLTAIMIHMTKANCSLQS